MAAGKPRVAAQLRNSEDRALQRLQTAVGNLCFRSRWSTALYNISVGSSGHTVRLAGMVVISLLLLARSARLFIRPTPGVAAILTAYAAAALTFGILAASVAALVAALVGLTWTLRAQPQVNVGHRAGAKGFAGPQCENSVEALAGLVARDNDPATGPLADFQYIEFDVHETADGQLVVLHDHATLTRAFPPGPANDAAIAALRAQSIDHGTATVYDLTLAQLHSLALGGRPGLRAPTLAQMLDAAVAAGAQRSIAVEVKGIRTDAARAELLRLVRQYKEGHGAVLEASCPQRKYAPFGWIAVISFPFFWAPSFGEFGSAEWRHWGRAFKEAGIPVRCCILHALDLCHGA